MASITLLGTGKMGYGIGLSILRSGNKLTVWNRNRQKVKDLVDRGAVYAETPALAVMDADYVISMLSDDLASEMVWLGNNGALNHLREGAFVIECSTLSLEYVYRLAEHAYDKKLRYIDCPVTGIPTAAEKGELTLLVGAAPEDLTVCEPILQLFSRTIRHFGAVGKGTCYKLIINLMGAVQIAALAEGIALADKLGLDRAMVAASIETSAAASPQVIRYATKMAERNFSDTPSFTIGLREKDARYALSLAATAGFNPRLGAVACDWFAEALVYFAEKDEATVIEMMN